MSGNRTGEAIWASLGSPEWDTFEVHPGEILEVRTEASEESPKFVMVITEVWYDEETEEELVKGRFIAYTDEKLSKGVGNSINRKHWGVHLCSKSPCDYDVDKVAAHVTTARWFSQKNFECSYLKPWGRLVLKEFNEMFPLKEKKKKTPPSKTLGDGRRKPRIRMTPHPRDGKRKRSAAPEDERGTGGDGTEIEGLRKKLKALKERLISGRNTADTEVIDLVGDGEESEGETESPYAREGRLTTGSHLDASISQLALEDLNGPHTWARGGDIHRKVKLELKDEGRMKGRRRKAKKTEEGACKALPIAGSSRATGEAEEGEERKGEEERKRKALIRGKGFGEAVGKEGDKEEKQRWWRTVGKQQFTGEFKLRGRGEFIGVGLKGATAEEVSKEPRIGDEDASAPLPRGSGSVISSCGRGEVSSDVWRQTGDVFQSFGEAALSKHQPGHEGDVHVGSGAGSITVRQTTRSWRRPGLPLFGGALRSKRRKLVSGQVPGDVSSRGDAVSAHRAVAESSKASPLDTEESRCGAKQLDTPVQSRRKLERRRKRRGERKRKRKEGKRQRPTAVLAERQLESMAEPRGSVVEEAERAERNQGESGKGKNKGRQMRADEIFVYERGEEAPDLGIHYELFGRLLEAGSSLRSVGCLLAWSIIHATCMSVSEGRVTALRSILAGKYGSDLAMRRLRNKEAFPLRLGGLAGVIRALRRVSLEEVSLTSFVREWSDDCWLFCSIEYNNYLHGCRSSPVGCWRKSDLAAVGCLRRAVERTLAQDVHLPRSVKEVEKELSHRFVSYSGGEVPTMEILTFDQVVPALPPKDMVVAFPLLRWLRGELVLFFYILKIVLLKTVVSLSRSYKLSVIFPKRIS